ncbi:unnamed protein product [Phaeothamnion confervicola]
MITARVLAGLAGVALLRMAPLVHAGCCPNACSGHGSCSVDDSCVCYSNWQSGEDSDLAGDCADRACPYEFAWADAPGSTGLHHRYAECSNKGTCNRESGTCECFEGFSGKACQRMTCPNDCSGQGRCVASNDAYYGVNVGSYLMETATPGPYLGGTNGNDAMTFAYAGWDEDMTRLCVCDPGFEGVDCSLRSCPTGNDIMKDSRSSNSGKYLNQVQAVCFVFGSPATEYAGDSSQDIPEHASELGYSFSFDFFDSDSTDGDNSGGATSSTSTTTTGTSPSSVTNIVTNTRSGFDVTNFRTFALSFTTTTGERFTTVPINLFLDGSGDSERRLANYVEQALEGLPAGVVDDVKVRADLRRPTHIAPTMFSSTCDALITVEFTGTNVQGTQNLLEVEYQKCGAGCTPRITGLPLATTTTGSYLSFVAESQTADTKNWVCGGRGKCDYTSGQCQCYSGFYGLHCEVQTALI